jgi:hypothetical protein
VQGTPAALKRLPGLIHTAAVQAYVHSIDDVFLVATPIVALAFIFALLLPEIRLRSTVRTSGKGADSGTEGPGTQGPTFGGRSDPGLALRLCSALVPDEATILQGPQPVVS